MIIEWLRFKVTPEAREKFIQIDEKIWTPALAKNPGFLGKEVWLEHHQPDEVVLVIHWATLELWQSFPTEDLETTESLFKQQMGETSYQLIEAREYQINKPLR